MAHARHANRLSRLRAGVRTSSATSFRMKGIRRSSTDIEVMVRRMVSALGSRYTISNQDLPGSPDLANRTRQWALFVHGCFWHHHSCAAGRIPRSNKAFWSAKLADNAIRDERKLRELKRLGFRTLVLWGCEIKECERGDRRVRSKLIRFLRPNRT